LSFSFFLFFLPEFTFLSVGFAAAAAAAFSDVLTGVKFV